MLSRNRPGHILDGRLKGEKNCHVTTEPGGVAVYTLANLKLLLLELRRCAQVPDVMTVS